MALSLPLLALGGALRAAEDTAFIIPHFMADELENTAVPATSIDVIGTEIVVVNPSEQAAEVTIESFDDEGNSIPAGGGSQTIAPGGLALVWIADPNPVSGWLRISTNAGAVVRGSIQLSRLYTFNAAPRLTVAEADPVEPFTKGSVPVLFDDPLDSTGIAIVYPALAGAKANEVSLVLRNVRGEVLGTSGLTVPRNGRKTFLIQDMFPQALFQGGFPAILEISADSPVYATAIEYQVHPIVWRTVRFRVAQ